MTDVTLTDNSDIYMDEQTTMNVTVIVTYDDGSLRDITGSSVTWVASFNGEQQAKKDTATMTIMLAPAAGCTVVSKVTDGDTSITVDRVAGFGSDVWGRPIPDFAVGGIVTITDGTNEEQAMILRINPISSTLTMADPIINSYQAGATLTSIISSFVFQLLPGNTILPPTKTYGTDIIWQHMAMISWPAYMSPGNIYQEATQIVGIRGRMFISPILSME